MRENARQCSKSTPARETDTLIFLCLVEGNVMPNIYVQRRRRRYSIIGWLFDCVMIILTCGFWLVRIYVREKRGN